jgi:predicted  nucleic acid-binding Zn-ribbon protein
MKPQEIQAENDRLKKENKENKKLQEQVQGLTKRIGELEQQKPASESRMQANAVLHLLEQGPVTMDQLAKINAKYPSDVIY